MLLRRRHFDRPPCRAGPSGFARATASCQTPSQVTGWSSRNLIPPGTTAAGTTDRQPLTRHLPYVTCHIGALSLRHLCHFCSCPSFVAFMHHPAPAQAEWREPSRLSGERSRVTAGGIRIGPSTSDLHRASMTRYQCHQPVLRPEVKDSHGSSASRFIRGRGSAPQAHPDWMHSMPSTSVMRLPPGRSSTAVI